MTTAILGWFIAGICFAALITLWFSVCYREISVKRHALDRIGEQVKLHRTLCMQERGGANDACAQNVLSGKLIAYREAEKEYNTLLKNPIYRIPARCMGFRPTESGGQL